MIGTDEELKLDVHAGVIYKRTLITTKKFEFNLGGGGAVKIAYEREFGRVDVQVKQIIGGAGILSLGFKF